MDQNIETQLKEALSSVASRIPTDVDVRLRAIDYRPRTSRLSPRLTVGALGGVAATAGTVISIIVLGGSQPAFAGWTASPGSASTAQTATADSTCQTQLADDPGPVVSAQGGSWSPVTTDVRGPFTVAIFQNGASTATCFVGPSITVVDSSSANGGAISGSSSVSRTGPAGGASSTSIMVGGTGLGDILHMSVARLNSANDGSYTLVEGQLQSVVTGLTLVRSDGSDVQASIGGGWFVAWWPGSQDVASAAISTVSGVTNEPLNLRPVGPPLNAGNGSCTVDNQSTSSGQCDSGDGTGGS
jgi:hypothetical protein